MKKILFAVVLFLLGRSLSAFAGVATVWPGPPWRMTFIPDTCEQSDVDEAVSMASGSPGTIIHVPGGDCDWSTSYGTISWTVPEDGIFECEGALTGDNYGTDHSTILNSDDGSNTPLLQIVLGAGGIPQIKGCDFINDGSGGGDGVAGFVQVVGTLDDNIRVHHNYCDFRGNCFLFSGHPAGDADHNEVNLNGGFAFKFVGTGDGDDTWAEDTNFGGADWFFMEKNLVYSVQFIIDDYNGGDTIVDGDHGAKWVVRNNILSCSGVQNHGTQASSRQRSARAMEVYRNDMTNTSYGCFTLTASPFPYAFLTIEGGGLLMWGNAIGTGVYQNKGMMVIERAADHSGHGAGNSEPPNSFGYCMPGMYSGVVSTSAISGSKVTITRVSGDNFNTSWFNNVLFGITNYPTTPGNENADIIRIGSAYYQINEVVSSTVMVVIEMKSYPANGGALTSIESQGSISWSMGSNIDTHLNAALGAICVDQPGTGKGDLLTGAFNPTPASGVLNSTNGDADSTSSGWAPRQRIEPLYEWLNTGTCVSGGCTGWFHPGSLNGGAMWENVTYYLEQGSFDGTVGTGSGEIGDRPMTCTAGTMYWATDEGEWDSTNGATPDGKSYICETTNNWTASYGAVGNGNTTGLPYEYPHPNIAATEGGGSPSESGSGRMRLRIR